jgi:hypothetical protein
MIRKLYVSTLALCTCLALAFQVGCGGSSSNNNNGGGGTTYTVSVAATPTTVTVGGAVSVTATTNDTAGVNWTASCASGATSCGSFSPATSLTAVAVTYTAPAAADTVTITGTSVTNSAVSATATVTVTAAAATNQTYVYYASGQEVSGSYYAVAGAVTIDPAGDIISGEQDYNDGVGNTSPGEPATPDTIAAGTSALVVDPTTGLGTLTMTSSNTNVGVGGLETFDVQFVNANHALIVQADGSATGSGSLDLQTATTTTGNFAFAASGVNPSTDSVAYGGVFAVGGSGIIDINDADDPNTPEIANTFTPVAATPDAFGRSVITGITDIGYTGSPAITFVTYPVGPEAMRMIDVDTTDTAVGSAFGQGSATFTNASLTSAVFTLEGQWSEPYATVGQFTTDSNGDGGIASGAADDNELFNGVQVENTSMLGSTYDLESSGINGYGSTSFNFQTSAVNVSTLGVYMTDPALNLNDPNNTTTDLGGALLADMDFSLPGGIGVITPQTDTTSTDFNGNYAAGFQDFNYFSSCGACEFDMVGPFTMASGGALSTASIGADDSDPLATLTGLETTADTYSSTPLSVSAGYFSMSAANTTANPLAASLNAGATTQDFNVDIYQASASTLYWIDWDTDSVFLGSLQLQPSGTVFPAIKKHAAKAQTKRK